MYCELAMDLSRTIEEMSVLAQMRCPSKTFKEPRTSSAWVESSVIPSPELN